MYVLKINNFWRIFKINLIFREAVFIAAALNRTVVPPPFFKHSRTDKSEGAVIHPWDRFDFTSLSKISKIINPKNLSLYCGDHIDVFFNTKRKFFGGTPSVRTNAVYAYTGLDYDTFPKSTIRKVERTEMAENGKESKKVVKTSYQMDNMLPPDTAELPPQGSIRLGTNEQKIRELWGSDGKCSLIFFPYHAIDFKKLLHSHKKKTVEIEWMKRIVLGTARPKHITYVYICYIYVTGAGRPDASVLVIRK